MVKYGILVNYEYCTGCHSCEVACKQEHDHPVGRGGIKVIEILMENSSHPHGISLTYVPCLTDLCDLCAKRIANYRVPSCVMHCPADCMRFGPIEDLVKEIKPKTLLWFPR